MTPVEERALRDVAKAAWVIVRLWDREDAPDADDRNRLRDALKAYNAAKKAAINKDNEE